MKRNDFFYETESVLFDPDSYFAIIMVSNIEQYLTSLSHLQKTDNNFRVLKLDDALF